MKQNREPKFHPAFDKISRTFAEGGFYPDWRLRQVERSLNALRLGPDYPERAYLLQEIDEEQDPFVLNFLALRRDGVEGVPSSYVWAWQRYLENDEKGLGSMIKALAFAQCPTEQIANWLQVPQENIEVFLALFWEIREGLKFPAFRSSIVFPFMDTDPANQPVQRERLLLLAAWLDGFDGLRMVLTGEVGLSAQEIQLVRQRLREGVLTQKSGQLIAIKIGSHTNPFTREPYLQRLRRIQGLPPSVEPARELLFESVMQALARGMALSEFV